MSGDDDEILPENCAVCGYHLRNMECRAHGPYPGHDEELVPALWNFTLDHERCGQGTTTKTWVPCWDCTHWHLPEGKPLLKPGDYKQGLPQEWWDQARLCTLGAPGATTMEGLRTFWRVTSTYVPEGEVGDGGGCGDGDSVTARLERIAAAERRRNRGL